MKATNIYHYCHIKVKCSQKIDTRILSYTDLTFVISGKLKYIVNKKEYELKSGDVIFVTPGMEESREALPEPVEYVSFNFTGGDMDFPIFSRGSVTPAINSLVNIYPAAHMYDSESATFEKCLCMLNYILLELEESCKKEGRIYSRVAQYVNSNITLPLSLANVSRELGMTKEYVASAFKKESNKTVTQYINEQKMILARNLIEGGEISLYDISDYLSYNNYNYFCRVFKKVFGTVPSSVRKVKGNEI